MMWILAKTLVLVEVAAFQLEGDHHHKHHAKHHAKAVHATSDVEVDDAQNKTSKKNVMKHGGNLKKNKAKTSLCWSYENVKHWETAFSACKSENQSPIAVTTQCKDNEVGCKASSATLAKHFTSTPVAGAYLSNNGHFIELVGPAHFATIKLGNMVWKSARVQFHTPAEHTLNGVRYPAEMQVVYRPVERSEENNKWTLITSVLLKEAYNRNALLSSIGLDMLNLPREEGDKMYVGGSVDLADGLKTPFEGGFAGYEGTLTSPPCTKDVLWFVAETPLEASATQIANLERRFPGGNNRPLHPIGSREEWRDFSQWQSHASGWSMVSLAVVALVVANSQ